MVYHVLADGTITKDITGRVVKISDAKPLYNLMSKINSSKTRVNTNKQNNERSA